MNLNKLAVEICKQEGKKKQTDIAQVKEILRVLIDILSDDIKPETPNDMGDRGNNFFAFIFDSADKKHAKLKKRAKKK